MATSESAVECIQLAESAGLILDDWQQSWLHGALAENGTGGWSAFEAALICARQNGKNSVLEAIELAAVFLFGERLIVHSAHQFSTSTEHFLRMVALVEGCSDLSRNMLKPITANGKECLRFRNGARILFKCRSRGGARGFTGDRIVFDEAYDLPPKAIGAMMPTLTTIPNCQVIYMSSAAHIDSVVLHSLMARARKPEPADNRLFFAEWGNPADVALDDVEAWRRANPAWGIRVHEAFLRTEWQSMRHDPQLRAEFAREVCGIPEGGDGEGLVIPLPKWDALVDPDSSITSCKSFGLDVSPERLSASFAVAGRRGDGLLHVETVDQRDGTDWVLERGVDLWSKHKVPLRIDAGAPAGSFIDDLRAAGVEVIEVPVRAIGQACGTLFDAVRDATLRHIGQSSLHNALVGAKKRPLLDAWLWSRQSSSVDITPLVAVTLALGGVQKPPSAGLFVAVT